MTGYLLFPKEQLQYALNFTDDDLVQNRLQDMTYRQARQLVYRVFFNNVPLLTAALPLVFWLLMFLGGMLLGDAKLTHSIELLVLCGGIPTILLLVLLADVARFGWSVIRDIRLAEVWSLSGRIEVGEERRYNGAFYSSRFFLVINDTWFRINQRTFRAFEHNRYYTVYFAPRSRIILSAENAY